MDKTILLKTPFQSIRLKGRFVYPKAKENFIGFSGKQSCISIATISKRQNDRPDTSDRFAFSSEYYFSPSCQKATAEAAATLRESTPWAMGMQTV